MVADIGAGVYDAIDEVRFPAKPCWRHSGHSRNPVDTRLSRSFTAHTFTAHRIYIIKCILRRCECACRNGETALQFGCGTPS
jgi:hypothetical protein